MWVFRNVFYNCLSIWVPGISSLSRFSHISSDKLVLTSQFIYSLVPQIQFNDFTLMLPWRIGLQSLPTCSFLYLLFAWVAPPFSSFYSTPSSESNEYLGVPDLQKLTLKPSTPLMLLGTCAHKLLCQPEIWLVSTKNGNVGIPSTPLITMESDW